MKRTISIISAILLTIAAKTFAGDIYVDPHGNDAGNGSSLQPLASPAAALRMAREWRRLHKNEAEGGIFIHLKSGVYNVCKPLFLRPEDSGTEGSPTVICGEGDKPAVLSGGIKLKGWHKGCNDERVPRDIREKVWVADAPMVGNRIVFSRQLWIGGNKAIKAQQGAPGEMTRMVDFDIKSRTITIPAPATDLSNAPQLEMTVHQRWAIAILRVKDIDNIGRGLCKVTFHEPESSIEFEHPWPQPVIGEEKGNSSFFLSNAPQLLDEPGEWYQDYPSGKIYYLPRNGEDMNTAEAVVPVAERLVDICGTRERNIHDISFKNVVFSHAAWTRPLYEGLVTLQAGFRMLDAYKLKEPGLPEKASLENQAWIARPDAAVSIKHAMGINFSNCKFEHLGATALDFEMAAHNSTVSNCLFSDIGGSGIMIGHFPDGGFETHVPFKPAIKDDLCNCITVDNNEIVDVANEDWGCVGINAGYVSNVNITHNELHRLNYSGICVGWGWTPVESGMYGNCIIDNYIHDFARQLYDVGGIYTLSNQPGSVISGNRIEDLHKAPYATNDRAFYIYFDEATDGYTVTDNWMPDSSRIGFNQPGKNMKIANNGPMVDCKIKEAAGRRGKIEKLKN